MSFPAHLVNPAAQRPIIPKGNRRPSNQGLLNKAELLGIEVDDTASPGRPQGSRSILASVRKNSLTANGWPSIALPGMSSPAVKPAAASGRRTTVHKSEGGEDKENQHLGGAEEPSLATRNSGVGAASSSQEVALRAKVQELEREIKMLRNKQQISASRAVMTQASHKAMCKECHCTYTTPKWATLLGIPNTRSDAFLLAEKLLEPKSEKVRRARAAAKRRRFKPRKKSAKQWSEITKLANSMPLVADVMRQATYDNNSRRQNALVAV